MEDQRQVSHGEVSTGCRDEGAARSVLGELERRAELVKSGVMTSTEDAIADNQAVPLAQHLDAYENSLRANEVGDTYRANVMRYLRRLADECGFTKLADLPREALEGWLTRQATALPNKPSMSARSRNAHRDALVTSDPTENRQRMAAGAENLVAPLVAPTRDVSSVSRSTAVTLAAFGQETDFADTLATTAVGDNEKRSLSLADSERFESVWRDLNPRPLAPQADLEAIPLLTKQFENHRLRLGCVVGSPLSQVKSNPRVFSHTLTVVGFNFSSASVVAKVVAFSNLRRLACEQLDISRRTPNWVRNNVATGVRGEFGIEAAQALAGHASPSMTAHYASKIVGWR